MDPKDTSALPSAAAPISGMDFSEGLPADSDEPPDFKFQHINFWLPDKRPVHNQYAKAVPPAYMRRESLLTRQLHSETEHSDEERTSPVRGLSMVSTWSNPSTVSTAELTSDDGRSVPSPATSPALLPAKMNGTLPVAEKPLATEPRILGLDTVAVKDPVEAGLGRKRCITFSCGNKAKPPATAIPAIVEEQAASPPKRKCALKFTCPSKPSAEQHKPSIAIITPVRRPSSPAPKRRLSSSSLKTSKVHRDSDSTVTTHASPRTPRKSPIIERQSSSPKTTTKSVPAAQLDNSDDSGAEATRFHEFATSEDEPDEWTKESTCYRNRLCVDDTLKKENVIRQLGQEVEEEALEEENEDEADDQDDVDDEDAPEDDAEEEDDDESDAGFHSDDEEGFAGSDSDGENSDTEWWTPGGISTAATSTDHLDLHNRIAARPPPDEYPSSLASMSSAGISPHSTQRRPRPLRLHSKSAAVDIERPPSPDLPDSTDFVCGTLDEDRPKEQAYINRMKEREAAKHRPVPQDIDPTFPTSDPEMDEEDDEDIEDPEVDSAEEMMHGSLDSIHGTARRVSPGPRRPSIRHRSPAPTAIRHRSPAPKPKPTRHSPPPARARSPAPKKLFGTSPQRLHSPAPAARMTSPPNTRRASPSVFNGAVTGLAERPNKISVTASLPKRSGGFLLSRLGVHPSDVEGSDTTAQRRGRRRGAIDIVKGLEKKKQRRKEKLCQKLAAKAAARGEERKKVKPGRGAERMREVGLELQKYKGRAGHILSY